MVNPVIARKLVKRKETRINIRKRVKEEDIRLIISLTNLKNNVYKFIFIFGFVPFKFF